MNKKEKENQITDNETIKSDSGACGKENFVEKEDPKQESDDNMSCQTPHDDDTLSDVALQVQEWQDKYLRLQADFDNFRKRTLKEKMELIDTAGAAIIKSLLTVVDDMDRAVEASRLTDNIDSMRQGVELINSKLYEVLRQYHVKEIPAQGEIFDTDYHDAVAKIPVEDEQAKGKVIDVIEKGYTIKEKVVRFSKVVVGE